MRTILRSANPDHYTIFPKEQENKFNKVTYFSNGCVMKETCGKITEITTKDTHEEFLNFDSGKKVPVGRVITINGKPGPAYNEYYMEMTVMPWMNSDLIQPEL